MDLTKKSSYFYNLPENLIAQTPIEPRDSSRLLVYNKAKDEITHKHFFDILDYLKSGDVLVINDTKVLPCRLIGIKQNSTTAVEVFLLKRIDLKKWEVLVKPGKKIKEGTIVVFSKQLTCKILENTDFGGRIVEFSYEGVFESILDNLGQMPLPPYIKTKLEDKTRYQTVYAKTIGSSAAPTAGLHFTEKLLQKVKAKGVQVVEVLLHVGLGTFRPVKEDNILQHKMHSEYYEVTNEAAQIINDTKSKGGRVIAVGTTSVRTLESCTQNGKLIPQKGYTEIFIYPSYTFKIVDALITNFHLPESTLIMLVAAFCGYEKTIKIYNTAVEQNYRFFSFGDAMFIE